MGAGGLVNRDLQGQSTSQFFDSMAWALTKTG